MLAKLLKRTRRLLTGLKKCWQRYEHPPPQRLTIDLVEAMKFEKAKARREVSVVSHANSNAIVSYVGSSQEMRKSTDALASLARGLQGRV